MFKRISLFLLVCFMAGCAISNNQTADLTNKAESHQVSHGQQWLTDMEKAQAIAKAEGKELFIFITGSDWCHWCQVLVKEVFSKSEFLDYAKENFVLVELDFPSDDVEMSEEQKAHNEKWKGELPEIDGYPTVYLTGADLNPYALTSYQEGGPKKYIESLEEMRSQKTVVAELSAKAAKASGTNVSAKEQEIVSLVKGKDDALYTKYTTIKTDEAIISEIDSFESQPTVEMLLAVYEKHKAVKNGDGLNYLFGVMGNCFIDSKRAKEGVTFMDKIISDNSYSLNVRQGAQLYQGIIMLYADESDERRTENALEMFEKTLRP